MAEIISAKQSTISRIEAGRLEPTEPTVAALCDVLGFNPSFFERPVVDEFVTHQCSFKHRQSTSNRLLDQAMARGTVLQEAVQAVAMRVVIPKTNVPNIPADDYEAIERAANACREHWGLGLRAPIFDTIQVAEHAGIVVTRLRGTTEKVDAFSRYGLPPVIALTSTRDSASRDRFNVAHEIGHLVIHRNRPTGDTDTERQADRFAEAFLLPAEVFSQEFAALRRADWPNIFEMKRRWKVEAYKIVHRATVTGVLDAISAVRLYKQFSYRRWHQGEPYEMPLEQPVLLSLAIEVAEREYGEGLSAIADVLGWRDLVAEEVTGIALNRYEAPPPNVASLDDYRK